MANDQHWDKYALPPIRGNIYSSDGFLLAGNQNYYLMYAEPNRIEDAGTISQLIQTELNNYSAVESSEANPRIISTDAIEASEDTKAIPTDRKEYYKSQMSKELLWVPLERKLPPDLKENIESLALPGIGFEKDPTRFYPNQYLASHVLGFVASSESGQPQGYFGIEGFFNEDLRGRMGFVMEEVDAHGRPILIGGIKKSEAIPGSDIYLTINRSVQYVVEKKLQEGVERYDARSGSVIVMDPLTGNIIAMANYPTFDPMNFDDFGAKASDNKEVFRLPVERRNLSVAEVYEPGSVMKPFTVAAGIDLDIISENTTFEDRGPVEYSGAVIDNWDRKHHGTQNIVELLQKSNNIGAAWVGHKVGASNLYKYLDAFGFGKKTQIALEGEDSGVLNEHASWTDIDLANISFGQGMSATPLQVLNAFNAFANNGFILKPRIISRIEDKGRTIEFPAEVERRVIKQITAQRMVDMLEKAAAGGEAKFFIKDYKISGKTGTAQIFDQGKYAPDKTNATFVGFLTESKKFSMIVRLNEPRATVYASESAVPLWMDIANELVKIYSIPPDRIE